MGMVVLRAQGWGRVCEHPSAGTGSLTATSRKGLNAHLSRSRAFADAGPHERLEFSKVQNADGLAILAGDEDPFPETALEHERVGCQRDQRLEFVKIAAAIESVVAQHDVKGTAVGEQTVLADKPGPFARRHTLSRRVARHDGRV